MWNLNCFMFCTWVCFCLLDNFSFWLDDLHPSWSYGDFSIHFWPVLPFYILWKHQNFWFSIVFRNSKMGILARKGSSKFISWNSKQKSNFDQSFVSLDFGFHDNITRRPTQRDRWTFRFHIWSMHVFWAVVQQSGGRFSRNHHSNIS